MANNIHRTAIIEGDVELGDSNEIGAYSVLIGPLKLGNDNIIGPHVCIGTPGQDTKNPRYDSSAKRVEIGHSNIIREHTAIQKPIDTDVTRLGSRNYLMHSVHIPHDARIADDVTITPMCALAGNAKLLSGANLGLSVSVHQHSVIGHYSMIAMNVAVTKNLRPFAKLIPGKPLSVNAYAVKKFGFQEYAQEIADYVEKLIAPRATSVKLLVDEFESLHQKSGRGLYA